MPENVLSFVQAKGTVVKLFSSQNRFPVHQINLLNEVTVLQCSLMCSVSLIKLKACDELDKTA